MITRIEFFEELLRGSTGKIELRRMKWSPRKNDKGGYDMLERLFSRDLTELEAFAHNGGGDVFHGVNLRDDSGDARKANIHEIVCAQADIDFKTTPKKQVDEALAVSIFDPTFFINSGNGYHLYWLLDSPLPATKERINLIESINRGLAEQFGGDFTHGAACNCCGQIQKLFLTVDQIYNDGYLHRCRGQVRFKLYRQIIKDGFPDDIQVVCFNCKLGRQKNGGICPHAKKGNRFGLQS